MPSCKLPSALTCMLIYALEHFAYSYTSFLDTSRQHSAEHHTKVVTRACTALSPLLSFLLVAGSRWERLVEIWSDSWLLQGRRGSSEDHTAQRKREASPSSKQLCFLALQFICGCSCFFHIKTLFIRVLLAKSSAVFPIIGNTKLLFTPSPKEQPLLSSRVV